MENLTNNQKEKREQIFKRINEIKKNSVAYQMQYGQEPKCDETNFIVPSKEFTEELLKKCAQELGIKYP